jgi:ApaG protein
MRNSAAVALYRATHRAIREATATSDGVLRIRQPVLSSAVQWPGGDGPQHSFVQETAQSVVQPVFPYLCSADGSALLGDWGEGLPLELNRKQLCAIARSRYAAEHADPAKALDDGFSALRSLHEQIELAAHTTVTRTEGVCVEASSAYRGKLAQNGRALWVFSYRIRVRNESSLPVKLLARHWKIAGEDGSVEAEVPKWGAGVVGQTPLLQPSAAFEYASGSTLTQPCGSIEGGLQMERVANSGSEVFEALVSRFPLRATPPRPGDAPAKPG